MDKTHTHSRNVGFGNFQQKQTLTSSYQQPTDVPEAQYVGVIQLFRRGEGGKQKVDSYSEG